MGLVAEIAETLAYAHRQGFVHRDIKPGNILFAHHGRALLTDFGIAFSPDDKAEGGSFGTLPYMSPEQVEGKALDHRSDIYSLGVVLYELLTGHLPHQATDPVELRREIVSGAVANITTKAGISTAGKSICRKCLNRNPADRYQDAAQLAQELRRSVFTVRPARPRNRLLALAAAVLLVLVGFFVVRGVLDRDHSPGVVETRTTLASERRAVEWVYSVGGFVNDTKRLDQLAEPWAMRSVYLHRDYCGDKVTDGDLDRLEGLPDLDTLNLGGARIDGSGLIHLRESRKLTWLSLECTQVDDAGLSNLAALSELTYLNLLSTPRITRRGNPPSSCKEEAPTMTVREAAVELQCSISFVYKLMTQGQVAYECRGRRKLPMAESVADYRQRNIVPASVKEPKPAKAPYQYKHLFQERREKRPTRLP